MRTPPATVFLLDPDAHATAAIRPGLATAGLQLVGVEANADQALAALMATRPDAIVIDVASCGDIASAVRRLLLASPRSCVIVTGSATAPAVLARAVASGARGFLLKPYDPADLINTIEEALDVVRSFTDAKDARPAARPSGKLIAVYSPKGGVGCTTIATNLALALGSRPKASVALIDLDLQFGDVGAALDLHSVNTVAEILKADTISPELIGETFVRHESGVRVLLAPEDLAVVDTIETEQVVRLLQELCAHFDFIVVDLWSSLDQLTRTVMRIADRVLLVTTPEFPAVRDVQRVLNATRGELKLDGRVSVVINRYPGKAGLPIADIAKALEHQILATIPSEGITVTEAINRGLSLLDSRTKVRAAGSYRRLATLVAEAPVTTEIESPRSARLELAR